MRTVMTSNGLVYLDSNGNAIGNVFDMPQPLKIVTPQMVKTDGDTDAQAIQKAINATIDSTSIYYKYAVYIPSGDYVIDSTIQLKDGVCLFGNGKKTVLHYHVAQTVAVAAVPMLNMTSNNLVGNFNIHLDTMGTSSYKSSEGTATNVIMYLFNFSSASLADAENTQLKTKIHDITITSSHVAYHHKDSAIINFELTEKFNGGFNGLWDVIVDNIHLTSEKREEIGYFVRASLPKTKADGTAVTDYLWMTNCTFTNCSSKYTRWFFFNGENDTNYDTYQYTGCQQFNFICCSSQAYPPNTTDTYSGGWIGSKSFAFNGKGYAHKITDCIPTDYVNYSQPYYVINKDTAKGNPQGEYIRTSSPLTTGLKTYGAISIFPTPEPKSFGILSADGTITLPQDGDYEIIANAGTNVYPNSLIPKSLRLKGDYTKIFERNVYAANLMWIISFRLFYQSYWVDVLVKVQMHNYGVQSCVATTSDLLGIGTSDNLGILGFAYTYDSVSRTFSVYTENSVGADYVVLVSDPVASTLYIAWKDENLDNIINGSVERLNRFFGTINTFGQAEIYFNKADTTQQVARRTITGTVTPIPLNTLNNGICVPNSNNTAYYAVKVDDTVSPPQLTITPTSVTSGGQIYYRLNRL